MVADYQLALRGQQIRRPSKKKVVDKDRKIGGLMAFLKSGRYSLFFRIFWGRLLPV